jgi:hypothetical protein
MKTCLGAVLAAYSFVAAISFPGSEEKTTPLKVCLVSGALEYDSNASLASLQKHLEKHYHIVCTLAFRKSDSDLPGLENLDTCDVMVLFTRRLTIDGEQLRRVKEYCLSGKPLVGIRTASHAFENWLALDKEVLGGNYQNHYPAGPVTKVELKARDHPILAGVNPFQSPGSLYKNTGLAGDVDVLLAGSIPGHTEPIAWTRAYKAGPSFTRRSGTKRISRTRTSCACLPTPCTGRPSGCRRRAEFASPRQETLNRAHSSRIPRSHRAVNPPLGDETGHVHRLEHQARAKQSTCGRSPLHRVPKNLLYSMTIPGSIAGSQ